MTDQEQPTPKPFTPEEIAGLNAAPAMKPFTPDEVAGLNAAQPHNSGFVDTLKSLGMGLVRGAGEGLGAAGDMADLAQLGVGKLAAWGDKKWPSLRRLDEYYNTRPEDIQHDAIDRLSGKAGPDLSSSYIGGLLDKAGISYEPQSAPTQSLYNVAHFAGSMLSPGGLGKAAVGGVVKEGLMGGAQALGKQVGKDLLVGTGAGLGSEAARGTINELGTSDPWVKGAMMVGGALAGGGLAGFTANRSLLYDKPEIVQQMEDAGVKPHFPSDVNGGDGGLISSFFSKILPDRFGAQGVSRTNARQTQDQLSEHVQTLLDAGNNPSLTTQGQYIKQQAEGAIQGLRDQTSAAYKDLESTIPGTTPVTLTKTRAALNDLVNRATDPDVKALLQTPTFVKYAALLNKPDLSWSDMNILRQEVGQSIEGAQGPERGLLKQLYGGNDANGNAGGILGDMRDAAMTAHPEGLEKFNLASQTAADNNEKIHGLLTDVVQKVNPETVPGWLAGQTKQGATRFNDLFDGLPPVPNKLDPGATPTKGDIARWMLGNAGETADGGFSLDNVMKYWKSRSPEAGAAMAEPDRYGSSLLDAGRGDGRGFLDAEQMYDATSNSRAIAGLAPKNFLSDPASVSSMGLGGALTIGHLAGGDPHAGLLSAAGMMEPMGANVLARGAQTPWLVSRFATPNSGDMMPRSQTLGVPASALPSNVGPDLFPDVYHPPATPEKHSELPAGVDVHAWLGSTDRASATHYIGQRLPEVAQQLASTDNVGYRAALFGLSSDPRYRTALAAGENDTGAGEAGFA